MDSIKAVLLHNGTGMNKTHHRLHRFINLIISKIESVSICVICGELIHNRKEMKIIPLLCSDSEWVMSPGVLLHISRRKIDLGS